MIATTIAETGDDQFVNGSPPPAPFRQQSAAMSTMLARTVLGAQHVDTSAASPAEAVGHILARLADPEDTILDTTSAPARHGPYAEAGPGPRWLGYGVGDDGRIDYEQAAALAAEFRPGVIIGGCAGHPRRTDFARLRQIADEVDALLIADICAVTGLVAAGRYDNPVDQAHVTVAEAEGSTFILLGDDAGLPVGGTGRTLTTRLSHVRIGHDGAAAAGALLRLSTAQFRDHAVATVANAQALARELGRLGCTVVSGGTDTHQVLLDVRDRPETAEAAAARLTARGIPARTRPTPHDSPLGGSPGGILLTTDLATRHGLTPADMPQYALLVAAALAGTPSGPSLAPAVDRQIRHLRRTPDVRE